MEKNTVVFAGLGQCGGVLVDTMLQINPTYYSLFVNSAIGDLSKLKAVDIDSNAFIYGGSNGTGGDREIAKELLERDKYRLHEFLKKYTQFGVMVVMASLDGGTGSGSLPSFIKSVRRALPHICINVVGVLPRLTEDTLKLKNTINCLRELEEVSDFINDIKFIDNNTRMSYEEINEEALCDIDAAYSIVGNHPLESIDTGDSYNVNNSIGYGIVLRLPDRPSGDLISDIAYAANNSVFALPEDLLPREDGTNNMFCEYAGINVSEGSYDYNEIRKYITATKRVYKTYNNIQRYPFNYIVLGGSDTPTHSTELIELEVEKRESALRNRTKRRGFGIMSDFEDVESTRRSNRAESNNRGRRSFDMEEEDLDDLFDTDFFKFGRGRR